MDRDPTAQRYGYSAWSYCEALQQGLFTGYRQGDRFMQDNAPIHTASITRQFLADHGIEVVDFPPIHQTSILLSTSGGH